MPRSALRSKTRHNLVRVVLDLFADASLIAVEPNTGRQVQNEAMATNKIPGSELRRKLQSESAYRLGVCPLCRFSTSKHPGGSNTDSAMVDFYHEF